jgi:VWFA-related protein
MVSAAASAAAGRLPGQQPDVKYTANVSVVNVLATVRNKQGQIVRDLSKEDFKLEEDNRPQVIRYFSAQSDLPLTLGLLVDTSGSQRRLLDTERRASYRFLDQVLREDKDVAFVIHFDQEVELLQDLTSSRKLLESALESLAVSEPRPLYRRGGQDPQSGGGRNPQGGGRGRRIAGTTLYDAVLLASDELMKKQQGRKALILLSDGVDNGSKVTLESAIESAQRADTLVYSIRYYDEEAYRREFPGGRGGGMGGPMGRRGGMGRGSPIPRFPTTGTVDGKKILQRISRETGAGYFEPSSKQPIDRVYALIEEELRNQYNLGYTSDKPGGAGEYRKIHVAVTRKGLVVQARDGYYAH